MGLFGRLFSGGAAMNVLGGMAQQYNKISDEKRAEEFTKERDDVKYTKEKELVDFRTKLENQGALKRTIEKAKIDKAAKIEVQKLKLKEAQAKSRPKGTTVSFKQYFPDNLMFADDKLIPKRSDFDKNTFYDALRREFKPEYLDALSSSPLYASDSTNKNYKNDVDSLGDTIVSAALDTLEVIEQNNTAGNKVKDLRITTPGFAEYIASNPILSKAFARKYPAALKRLQKELNMNIGDGGAVSEIKEEKDGSAKITYTIDDRYYKTNNPNVKKDKLTIQKQIQGLNHPDLVNLNVPERMGKLDRIVEVQAENLYKAGNGGEIILNAVSKLTPKLNTYTKPLQDTGSQIAGEVRKFFEEDELGRQIASSPSLAIQIVAMSLPPSVKGTVDFKPLAGALVGNQVYSETQDFKKLQEDYANTQALSNANKLGFKDIESRDYKEKALRQAMLPARELIKLLSLPEDQRVYVGANEKFFNAWNGIQEQFDGFVDLAKEQINARKGLFDASAVKELRKVQKETNEFLRQSQDSSLSQKQRNSALFNYYAGVLTFTMAAAVQGGSDGAVDSRTISDKDVQLWKTILNLGTNLPVRGGTLAILNAIVKDAEIKISILQGMRSEDDRVKSAAKIVNRGYYGEVSISSYDNLQKNYGKDIDDITQVQAGDVGKITYDGESLSTNNITGQNQKLPPAMTGLTDQMPKSESARRKALTGTQ